MSDPEPSPEQDTEVEPEEVTLSIQNSRLGVSIEIADPT